jgi:sugar lactone lactonase YvrE
MKRSVSTLFLTVGLLMATAGHAAEKWRASGFKTPESVLYDTANKRLIVSNINGGMTDVDGNGYLSLVSMDGKVVAEQWASGMDAPKGMAISGNRLYVADITQVRVVDLATGKIAQTVKLDGAVFLNDVTANKAGEVFVTDTMANAIYRIAGGNAELWLQDALLNSPNGILADGNRLIVGTWGKGIRQDFTTEEPGGLIAIDVATKKITPLPQAEKFGNIDGVVKVGDDFIVSDYMAGILYRYSPGKSVIKIATLKPGSADIDTDGKTVFVPMMMEGEVVAISLEGT